MRAWVRGEDGVEGQSLWVWGTDAFYGGETSGRKVTRRKDWRGEERSFGCHSLAKTTTTTKTKTKTITKTTATATTKPDHVHVHVESG